MAQTDSEAPLLMTAAEVAAALAVNPRTIFRWRSAGTIPPPIQIGGATRWRRRDIEQFLEAQGAAEPRELRTKKE